MSDLDDEELKATRKLNGANRKEKTADEMFEELGYIKNVNTNMNSQIMTEQQN